MNITTGLIMVIAGSAGAFVCVVLLLICGLVFPKQRKKLLKKLQEM